MSILHVRATDAEFLANHYPESGMGYQLVEGSLPSMGRTAFLALNFEYVIPFGSLRDLHRELAAISEWGIEAVAERDQPIWLRSEPSLIAELLGWRLSMSALDPDIPASELSQAMFELTDVVGVQRPTEPRLYFRYSPFRNDRRVLPTGEFVRGTYATTFNDMKFVPSGFAAVGRYALPSTLSARFVFTIVTDASPIYIGTATPNFGQAGGGVEVVFPGGAMHLPGVPHRAAEDWEQPSNHCMQPTKRPSFRCACREIHMAALQLMRGH